MRSNLNPKLTILASTENTDLDNKKKYGTLNRGLRAIASNFKLKRNLSTGRLSGKEEALSSESGRLGGGDPSEIVPNLEETPPNTDENAFASKEELLAVADNLRPFGLRRSSGTSKQKIEGDIALSDQKMIAPHNPPPPIPSINSVVFPKRTQVGSAAELLSSNGFTKAVAMNGHAPVKQNGSQSPLNGASTQKISIPTKTDKPVPKELLSKDLISLPNYPKIKLNGTVGFGSLPYQVVRRSQQRGFQFNLLCVGEVGVGKTTLLESLFGIKLSDFEPCDSELNTVELKSKQCEITDSNVNVKLRLIETAGFGDQLDKEKSAKVIVNFINEQFEARLKEELMIKRGLTNYEDKRIHACLYFISPTERILTVETVFRLKALDIVTMKELAKRVNIIPVIAKSDTTSKDELTRFKAKILSELRSHNIEIYQFPTEDEAVADQNKKMNSYVPFAVVGSTDFVTKEDGTVVRARNYPWGRVEVENKEHCDFIFLREAILRTNVDALRERTHAVLYEAYRRDRLRELKMRDGDAGPNMEQACELRQKEFREDLDKRDKKFSEDFVRRVDEKEMELRRREELLNIRRRDIEESYQNDLRALEQKIVQINDEKTRLLGGKKSKKYKALHGYEEVFAVKN